MSELEQLIAKRTDARRKGLQSQKAWYIDQAKRLFEKLKTADEETRALYLKRQDAIDRLRDAKIAFSECAWNEDLTVRVDQTQLPAVARALGRLDPATQRKEPKDQSVKENKDKIEVTISPARYPFVTVTWERKLKRTDKCKIRTQKKKVLVCEL